MGAEHQAPRAQHQAPHAKHQQPRAERQHPREELQTPQQAPRAEHQARCTGEDDDDESPPTSSSELTMILDKLKSRQAHVCSIPERHVPRVERQDPRAEDHHPRPEDQHPREEPQTPQQAPRAEHPARCTGGGDDDEVLPTSFSELTMIHDMLKSLHTQLTTMNARDYGFAALSPD